MGKPEIGEEVLLLPSLLHYLALPSIPCTSVVLCMTWSKLLNYRRWVKSKCHAPVPLPNTSPHKADRSLKNHSVSCFVTGYALLHFLLEKNRNAFVISRDWLVRLINFQVFWQQQKTGMQQSIPIDCSWHAIVYVHSLLGTAFRRSFGAVAFYAFSVNLISHTVQSWVKSRDVIWACLLY